MPSAHVRVMRAITAVLHISSFHLHLGENCFSVLKSLKQPGKGSSSIYREYAGKGGQNETIPR